MTKCFPKRARTSSTLPLLVAAARCPHAARTHSAHAPHATGFATSPPCAPRRARQQPGPHRAACCCRRDLPDPSSAPPAEDCFWSGSAPLWSYVIVTGQQATSQRPDPRTLLSWRNGPCCSLVPARAPEASKRKHGTGEHERCGPISIQPQPARKATQHNQDTASIAHGTPHAEIDVARPQPEGACRHAR